VKMTFTLTVVVSPLKHCSSDILGIDFLQAVGAEISLTAHSLFIGHCYFPLKSQEQGATETQRLITEGQTDPLDRDQERGVELVGD